MQYLAQGLGVAIDSRILPSYAATIDAMRKQSLDLVTMGPQLYVEARRAGLPYRVQLCRSHRGRGHYFGEVIVHADDPIASLEQLRGKRVAFVSPNSTTGFSFAAVTLRRAGVRLRELADTRFLGSHDKVVRAVASKQFDAGAVFESAAKGLIGDDGDLGQQVRTLSLTDPVPNEPICSSERFRRARPELVVRLVALMRGMGEDPAAQAALNSLGPGMDGYAPTDDAAYDVVAAALLERESATSGLYPAVPEDDPVG